MILAENIPEALRSLQQWVTWREETRNGKPTKIPRVPGSHRNAESDNPATWVSFDAALAKMNGDAGIGFVFTREAGIAGIDLDHCRDRQTGKLAVWAQRIAARISSYTEISPSGEGLHLLVKNTLPAGARKRGSLEMYDEGRFFTVTGNRLEGAPATIEQADVAWLHRLMAVGVFNFGKCPKLRALLAGDINAYASQSEADLALCGLLASFGLNAEEIDSAFRLGALANEKWERTDYRERTIGLALESRIPTRPVGNAGSIELLRSESGAARAVLQNAVTMLRQSSEWVGCIGFDEFSRRVTARKLAPGFTASSYPRDWTDQDDTLTACWLQRTGILVNSRVAAEAVQTVARENPFHPVREYLRSLTWDGVERTHLWLPAYFEAAETDYAKAVGTRWLISAVARVIEPGCQCDHTLLLEGSQGLGKSSGLRALVGGEWFTDHLSPLGSKDSRVELLGKWVVEISELSAMRRAEIETVKSYLSERADFFRPPYARRAESFPRQCVFAATTNAETPFQDESGARRFWPVRCGRVAVDALARARDMLWAEAFARYQRGEAWWLESQELSVLAASEQEARYEPGARDAAILAWCYEPQRAYSADGIASWNESHAGCVNATDCLIHGIGIPLHQVKQADHKEVARCLRHAGWERRRDGPRRNLWYYHPPAREAGR